MDKQVRIKFHFHKTEKSMLPIVPKSNSDDYVQLLFPKLRFIFTFRIDELESGLNPWG